MSSWKKILAITCVWVPLLASLSACAPKITAPVLVDQGSIQIITHSATQVATYMKKGESKVWFCKENVSDAVRTSQEGVTLGAQERGATESAGEGKSTGAMSLGGMSSEVLIISELLYRACEVSANLNADEKSTLAIYKMFLNVAQQTAATQTEAGAKATVNNPAALGINVSASAAAAKAQANTSTASDATDSSDSDDSSSTASDFGSDSDTNADTDGA